jgi:SNF2 family DNA or RNA helicase
VSDRLWAHQREALRFIDTTLVSNPKTGVGIWAGMGSGKSRIAIEALRKYGLKRVLILAPKSVVANVWEEQFSAWAPEYTCLCLGSGTIASRLKRIQQHEDTERLVVVLNYEAVYRPQSIRVLGATRWDALIMDESHRLARPGGKTSRTVRKLAQDVPFRLALTGTPISGSTGPLAIWAQAAALDPRIYQRTYTEFRSAYTEPCRWGMHDGASPPRGGGPPQPWRYRNLDDLQQRMASFSYRVETDQVLDLPPETDLVRTTVLEPKARKVYRELEEELIADIEGGVVVASNALTRLLRLQQLTGGSLKTEDGEYVEVSTAKRKLLEDVLEDYPLEKPLVVVCRFHRDLDAVNRVCHNAGRQCFELSGRKDELRKWKSLCASRTGRPVLAVQIQSGGIGISLVEADTCLFYSPDFSLTGYDQMRARIRRPGQKHPVTFLHLTVQGTIDQDVYKALQARADLVEATLEGLLRR